MSADHRPSLVLELAPGEDVFCLECAQRWPCSATGSAVYSDDLVTLHHGDSRKVLSELLPESVDAVVTDPPYELGFMGKGWDSTGIAYDIDLWRECLRVLKPGGHLLAFGGTRTYHRMVCAIEDAGFEIRDSIHWLYGSGFPKSLDVSKAIDKGQGETHARQLKFTAWMRSTGITVSQINNITNTQMGNHYLATHTQPAIATADLFDKLRPHLPEVPEYIERLIAERTGIEWADYQNRIKLRTKTKSWVPFTPGQNAALEKINIDITAPATPDAERWQGWGTALKPAHEPIVVARKPLAGTVAGNVLTHGVGGLNIDACRVGTNGGTRGAPPGPAGDIYGAGLNGPTSGSPVDGLGRWPANIVITHTADCRQTGEQAEQIDRRNPDTTRLNPARSGDANGTPTEGRHATDRYTLDTTVPVFDCAPDCPAATLDQQSGKLSRGHWAQVEGIGYSEKYAGTREYLGRGRDATDTGGASRFFTTTEWHPEYDAPFYYSAKAGRRERPTHEDTGRGHATVKPLALMRWLVRLVTPPGGIVLDPFAGSGTTLEAATVEGFKSLGIELENEHISLILQRINRTIQLGLNL